MVHGDGAVADTLWNYLFDHLHINARYHSGAHHDISYIPRSFRVTVVAMDEYDEFLIWKLIYLYS